MELEREEIDHLARQFPGAVAVYLFDGTLRRLFISDEVPALIGFTPDEYGRFADEDALQRIVSADRAEVLTAIEKGIRTTGDFDIACRMSGKKQDSSRIDIRGRMIGEMGGKPVILCVFTDNGFETTQQNAIADLRHMLEREQRLIVYIQTLNGPGSLKKRLNQVLKTMGAAFNADRTYIFEMSAGRTTNTYEWCRTGVASEKSSFQGSDDDFAHRWIPELEHGRSVFIANVAQIENDHPAEYKIMRDWGVESYIEAPIMSDGKLAGFIGADNPDVDIATASDDLLLSLAYYVSNTITRERDRRNLEASQRRFELAIDGAELGVWEYDIRKHTISSPSNSFAKFGVTGTIENVPESILPMFAPEDQEKLLDFYRRLESGEHKLCEDFWMRWNPGTPRRCERVTYTVIDDAHGRPDIAYGIGMNYTAQKQEQENYQHSLQALLSANPEAFCTFPLNLTRNLCGKGHGIAPDIQTRFQSDTVTGLYACLLSLISDEDDRTRVATTLDPEKLIAGFENGVSSIHTDYRWKREDGTTLWIRTYVSVLQNPLTRDIEAVVYSTDITKEKREESIFKLITDREYDYVALLYPATGKVQFLSIGSSVLKALDEDHGKLDEIYDYESARKYAVMGWTDEEGFSEYLKASALKTIIDELEKNKRYEYTTIGHCPDAPEQPACREIQHYYLDESKDAILILETDVTETYLQQQREVEQIKAEAKRTQDIMNTISGGIGMLRMSDPYHLRIEYVNHQLQRMLGFEVVGNTAEELDTGEDATISAYFADAFSGVHPDDAERVKKAFYDNFDSAHFVIDDYRTLGVDGKYHWIREEVNLREVADTGHVFYAMYYDVSEEVRLKHELEKQLENEKRLRVEADAANKAKSDFLASVSHDMRMPLNAVLGYTELARNAEPDEVSDYLSKIERSGRVLQQLIDDTLDLNKISTGEVMLDTKPTDTARIFDDLLTTIVPFAQRKGVKLIYGIEDYPDSIVLIDEVRVRQVILNLLNNAIKFTPAGGTVTFSVERLSTVGNIAHDRGIVSDTGCGMSKEFLPKIFEPFSQERTETNAGVGGSGLGLSIVKRLVELMGGRIEVESELGHGTTFTIYIDFELAEPSTIAPSAPHNHDQRHRLAGRKALLIEDNSMNTEIAQALLQRQGMEVDCADNGAKGVEMFAESKIDEYDIVLMDVRMPVMDGLEATRVIRALDRPDARTVSIIAMTANAFDGDVQDCLDAGMDAHTAKPIDPDTLYDTIAQFL